MKSVKSALGYITWDNSETEEARRRNEKNFPIAFTGKRVLVKSAKKL